MNKLDQIIGALVALAKAIPDLCCLDVQPGGYVALHIETEEQAHAVAASLGVELSYLNSQDGEHRWLRGSRSSIYVYGPGVVIPRGAVQLDDEQVDAALALANGALS